MGEKLKEKPKPEIVWSTPKTEVFRMTAKGRRFGFYLGSVYRATIVDMKVVDIQCGGLLVRVERAWFEQNFNYVAR